jgi:hypothetical protein
MVRNPAESRVLVAVGFLHLALAFFGIQVWRCPILVTTGVPCPGCGLSRASAAILHGDWKRMAELHIFAPFLVFTGLLTGLFAILPGKYRIKLLEFIERFEEKSRFTFFLFVGLIIYWGVRLGQNPNGFIALMKSTP